MREHLEYEQEPLTLRNGTYRIMKCKAMLRAIDATKYGLTQIGITSSDSFSLSELHALSISMTTPPIDNISERTKRLSLHDLPTRIDRDMVVADLA